MSMEQVLKDEQTEQERREHQDYLFECLRAAMSDDLERVRVPVASMLATAEDMGLSSEEVWELIEERALEKGYYVD